MKRNDEDAEGPDEPPKWRRGCYDEEPNFGGEDDEEGERGSATTEDTSVRGMRKTEEARVQTKPGQEKARRAFSVDKAKSLAKYGRSQGRWEWKPAPEKTFEEVGQILKVDCGKMGMERALAESAVGAILKVLRRDPPMSGSRGGGELFQECKTLQHQGR